MPSPASFTSAREADGIVIDRWRTRNNPGLGVMALIPQSELEAQLCG